MFSLSSFSNLNLSTDFVDNWLFLPLKIQQNAQKFSSVTNLPLRKKYCFAALNSSTFARRTTNYQSSSWEDSQIQSLNTSAFTGEVHEKRREKLKEEVKCLIKEMSFADQLELFDCFQKLGIAYHFEEEIKDVLNFMKSSDGVLMMDQFSENVYFMALYFRLSREHGLEVSKDLLVKSYKNENGCIKPYAFHDTKGMLSLYEASFLAKNGEEEVDEANEFAHKQLNDFMSSNSSENPLLEQHVALALELPLHHRISKLQAPMFMEQTKANPVVLELAQLDFNMTQSIYRRELKEIMWWEFATSLPEYMKICIKELFNMVNCLASKIMEDKGLDILPYLKRARLDLCKAYMMEARWYYSRYCPTFEEFLGNAWISVAAPLISVTTLCLSENLINRSIKSCVLSKYCSPVFHYFPAL